MAWSCVGEPRFAALAAEIADDLAQLAILPAAAAELRPRLQTSWVDRRAAGSVAHDFYNGAERIFERIARGVDGDVPSGGVWHAELLRRMALTVPSVRPAVLTSETVEQLRAYLRFRHVFRNLYGDQLDHERLDDLLERLDPIHARLSDEISAFAAWLVSLAENT